MDSSSQKLPETLEALPQATIAETPRLTTPMNLPKPRPVKVDLSLPYAERVLKFQREFIDDPEFHGFEKAALKDNLRLISAELNRTEWELEITPILCNKGANLYGGAACVLLDNLTTTALLTAARPGFFDGGHVSRSINLAYLRPVPGGSTVRIVCELITAGKTMAYMKGDIILNGKVCVSCTHDKVVVPIPGQAKPAEPAKL